MTRISNRKWVALTVTLLALCWFIVFAATHTFPRFYREGGKVHTNITIEFCVPFLPCPEAMG